MHQDLFHKGKKLVSVTQLQAIVSKPFLELWKQSLCEENVCGFVAAKKIAEEAAEFSNVIHEEVAEYLNSGKEPSSEWGIKIVNKMKEGEVKKHLLAPEETLRCNEALLSGSPDMVCEGFGKVFIGDNKIKKSMDLATGAQLYGYRLLIRKNLGVDISVGAVFFGNKKTGKLDLKWIDLDDWKKYFEALVTVWNRHNPSRCINLKALKVRGLK